MHSMLMIPASLVSSQTVSTTSAEPKPTLLVVAVASAARPSSKTMLIVRIAHCPVSIQTDIFPTAEQSRQKFIIRLAKALLTYGAPSHRIESQLNAAATVLEIEAAFLHMSNVIIVSFGEQETGQTTTKFVKAIGRLQLGKLHETHSIYKSVAHDEIGAEEGAARLGELLKSPAVYGDWTRCFIAFACAALICPLAFEGSILDMGAAGCCGFILAFLQLFGTARSPLYANVFE